MGLRVISELDDLTTRTLEELRSALLDPGFRDDFVTLFEKSDLGRPRAADALGHAVLDAAEALAEAKRFEEASAVLEVLGKLGEHLVFVEFPNRVLSFFKGTNSAELGVAILQTFRQIIALKGPDSYFRFNDVPLFCPLQGGLSTDGRGYTITAWLRLAGVSSIPRIIFSVLSENGSGIQVFLVKRSLEIRVMPPFEEKNKHAVKCSLPIKDWFFLALVHVAERDKLGSSIGLLSSSKDVQAGKMLAFIDGKIVGSSSVPYPSTGFGSGSSECANPTMTIGGFSGDMGAFHLFGQPLNAAHIASMYISSPSFSPAYFVKDGREYSRFISIRSSNSGYVPFSLLRLAPRNVVSDSLVPDDWYPIKSKPKSALAATLKKKAAGQVNRIVVKRDGVHIKFLPNNKKMLFIKGGLKLILYATSPQFPMHGRRFRNSTEVSALFDLIAEVVSENPANLSELATIGMIGLKQYLLAHVAPSDRNFDLLFSVKNLVEHLEGIIDFPVVGLNIITDAFQLLIFDLDFWAPEGPVPTIMKMYKEICIWAVEMVQKYRSASFFRDEITITYFFFYLRIVCREFFVSLYLDNDDLKSATLSKSPRISDISQELLDIAKEILSMCILLIRDDSDVTPEVIQQLSFLIEDCSSPLLTSELYNFLLFCTGKSLETVRNTLLMGQVASENDRKRVLYGILVKDLKNPSENARICAVKLLGILLNSFVSSSRQLAFFTSEFNNALLLQLSGFPLTQRMCDAVLEVVFNIIKLGTDTQTALDEEILIKHPSVLCLLLDFASAPGTDNSVKEKLLLDIMTLFKTNERNIQVFIQENFWQKSVLQFMDKWDTAKVKILNQLSLEILQTVLWYCISKADNGWSALDYTIWMFENQTKLSEVIPAYQLKIMLSLQFMTRLNRVSIDARAVSGQPLRTSVALNPANIKMMFLLIEEWLFEDPNSFIKSGRPPSDDDMILYSRFLQGAIEYLNFESRRLQILRLMYRYMKTIFVHPSCQSMEGLIVLCIRHVFLIAVQGSSTDDYRSIRLALTILRQHMETFLRTGDQSKSRLMRFLIQEIYGHWGEKVFNPVSIAKVTEFPTALRVTRPFVEPDSFVTDSDLSPSGIDKLLDFGDKTVSISTIDGVGGGVNPALSSKLKAEKKEILPDEIEEEALLLMYQTLKEDDAETWLQEAFANFVEGMSNRCDKIHQRMLFARQLSEERQKDAQADILDGHLAPLDFSITLFWREVIYALKSVSTNMWKKHSDDLYRTVRILKDFAIDFDSKNTRFENLSLICSKRYGDPKEKLNRVFWKLDRSENSLRMRTIMRRNIYGHEHKKAVYRSDKELKAQQQKQLELQKMGAGLKKALRKEATDDDATEDKELESKADEVTEENEEEPELKTSGTAALASSGVATEVEEVDADEDHDNDSSKRVYGTYQCSLITPLKTTSGTLIISNRSLSFKGDAFSDVVPFIDDSALPSGIEKSGGATSGSWVDGVMKSDAVPLWYYGVIGLKNVKNLTIYWSQIKMVLPRRYLLRQSAVEVFMKNGRSYLLNFSKSQRNEVFRMLCDVLRLPDELNPRKRVTAAGLTQKWKQRKISNFEYLMKLNTLAGRSYNDLTQYPVFPWIIKDYKSDYIDLNDISIYRDLSKPLGALNEARAELYREKYRETSTGETPAWHYGSHYSSAGIVLHYLIRMEPFTSINIHLQGGRFDVPDRLFNSVAAAWELSFNNIADVKELIPEFFYNPQFLYNLNNLDLGKRQDDIVLNDVVLPPWAKSPEHFVEVHAQALESEYVSQHLHEWIDLIFGYKQRGPEAVKALNVFFHLTYEGSVDIDAIEDPALKLATESQVSNFGQTPSQLFTQPHPARDPPKKNHRDRLFYFPFDFPVNYAPIPVTNHLGGFRNPRTSHSVRFTDDHCLTLVHAILDPINGLSVFRLDLSQILIMAIKLSQAKSEQAALLLKDPMPHLLPAEKILAFSSSQFNPSRPPLFALGPEWEARCFALSHSSEFLFLGGFGNASLKCQNTLDGSFVSSVAGHSAPVTVVKTSNDHNSIVTGAADGSVTLWIVNSRKFQPHLFPPLSTGENHIFAEHHGAVIDLSYDVSLGIIASISTDNTCVLYSIQRRRYLRTLEFSSEISLKLVLVCKHPRLVFYAQHADGSHRIYLYTINGKLLEETIVPDRIEVLGVTPEVEYVYTGDTNGIARFYDPAL